MAGSQTALDAAFAALRHRDRSAAELDARLLAKGFHEGERQDALETLRRTGVLDDRRFAESRGAGLAARGAGDALIRHGLVQAGVDAELIDVVIGALEPESQRALRIADRRGYGPKTARYLSGKGFGEDSLAALVANGQGNELG